MIKKNIIEVTDFRQKEWRQLIAETIKYKKDKHRNRTALKNKRVGLLFDSNSLRTRLSFESAVYLLGGDSYFMDVHNLTHEKEGTKRETFEDIIDTIDRMVDGYVVRDYSQQLLEVLKKKDYPPFINGFCQVGHPSQALADLSVISWKKKRLNKLNYTGVCPASGSGVMESFIYGILILGEKITIITPTGKLQGKNKDFAKQVAELKNEYGGDLAITNDINSAVKSADVLYVDEWWENTKDFLQKKMGKYRVDDKFLQGSKSDLSILHCLPAHPGREITESVMRSQQSIIFDQAEFRVYSAMSLLSYLLA